MILIYIILIILFLYNNQNLVKRYIPFEKFVDKEEEEQCAEEEKMLNEYKDKVEKAIELVSTLNNKVNELDNSIKEIAIISKHNTLTVCQIQKHSKEMDNIDT